MANKLWELFDENTVKERDLVASSPRTLAQMTASGSADPTALQTQVDITNQVRYKVDYSDFANFVHFNSALDYFNISGERMLNEWPYDGMFSDQLAFTSMSDGYQRYLLDVWPRWSGGAVFVTGAYVRAADVGYVSGTARHSLLSPSGTSMTFEFHVYVPQFPSSPFFVLQDLSSSQSGSLVNYGISIVSGALSYSFGAATGGFSITTSSWYFALVMDAVFGSATLYAKAPQQGTGYFDQFSFTPTLSPSASRDISMSGALNAVSTQLLVGSGSASSGWSGIGLSELRIWDQVQTAQELYANYNTRVYQEDGLQLYWKFAEGMSGSVVRDYSGHKLSGTITGVLPINFWTASFASIGNSIMSPQDLGEYNLNVYDTEVSGFIATKQTSGTAYDRSNSNIITAMVPFMYLYLEDERNTVVLKNLLYLLARQFDELKVAIDQIPNVLLPSYTGFDEAPDALLVDVLKFWGWDTKANFLSEDAFRYFFGYDVLALSASAAGTGSGSPPAVLNNQAAYDNQRLDITLDGIKKEFWHRTLQELIYIYKKKGTRESVEALLRTYGLDEKIVKLKEFGVRPDVSIQTQRINSNRSAWVREFTTSSVTVSSSASVLRNSGTTAVDFQVRFPTSSFSTTGTVFYLTDGVNSESLTYTRFTTSSTGTLVYAGLSASGLNIFDGRWYHVSTQRSGTRVAINIQHLDEDVVDYIYATGTTTGGVVTGSMSFGVGVGEFQAMNAQVWNLSQSWTDVVDHTLNPFSFGTETPEQALRLELNWMFDKDTDQVQLAVFDQSLHVSGSSSYRNPGQPYSGTFVRELFEYNFIAPPDYGWSEEKVRYADNPRPLPGQQWLDSSAVSLEFNLIDALNEDISLMLSSLDNWNNLIGSPANRHRESYPSLERFRTQYFSRLSGRINFRAFADFLDFFDRSFVSLVQKLLPARAKFKGAEFVVENHMLERPKVQYTYRRQSPMLVPEGEILIVGHSPLNIAWIDIEGP